MTTTTAPLIGATIDADGVHTTDVNGLSRDEKRRIPSFAALAKATGGRYAEQLDGMTVPQALAAAGLDFTVTKHEQVSVSDGDGGLITGLPRWRGTVAHFDDDREPVLLGIVGQGYEVIQPYAAAAFGQAVLEEGGATVAAIGAYGDPIGSRMFMALKLPEGLQIGGEDPYDLYLGIGNSFDRSTGLWAVAAPIRLDCTNQAAATFGKLSNRFTIRHMGDIESKVNEVQRALDLSGTFSERFATFAESLLTAPMVGTEIDEFVSTLVPTPKNIKTARGADNWNTRRAVISHTIRHGDRNTVGRGTRYAAYQGVVEWVDWMTGARSDAARAVRGVDGTNEELKIRAADLLSAGL